MAETTTPPWNEARREALTAAEKAFHNSIFVVRGRIPGDSCATHQIRHATNAYLSTLSRLGYCLVPAKATGAMIAPKWSGNEAVVARGIYELLTEAGDVLRVKP